LPLAAAAAGFDVNARHSQFRFQDVWRGGLINSPHGIMGEPHDETLTFPQFDILAVHGPLGVLDSLLILVTFDDLRWRNASARA
jgi:hypothetical protein